MPFLNTQPGVQNASDGSPINWRSSKQGDGLMSKLHGDRYETNYRGNFFSGGMTLTSISAATFTTATLGATCTPILGIWNPLGSGKNAIIDQSILQVILTALTSTGPGAFMWATSTGNAAISTGNTPLNRSTLQQAGSVCKDMSGVALTGLTNNLVVRGAAAIAGGSNYNVSGVATASGFQTTFQAQEERVTGGWIVPPGGVLALLCTTTPVAHSAASGWTAEEVPV